MSVTSGVIVQWGYCRVSSKDQNEARQIIAMKNAGIDDAHILVDKQSGKNFDRPAYKRLLKSMKAHDVLYIQSIDRLGRNYEEILEQWRYIVKRRGVDIVVVDMPILDTRTDRNLMGSFICDTVLGILSFVAENERVNIRQRQAEGIAAAKARGVRFGRPMEELPDCFASVCRAVKRKKLSKSKAARALNMPVSTFNYRLKRWEENKKCTSWRPEGNKS